MFCLQAMYNYKEDIANKMLETEEKEDKPDEDEAEEKKTKVEKKIITEEEKERARKVIGVLSV